MILTNPSSTKSVYFPFSLVFGPTSRRIKETLELQESFMISAYAQINRDLPSNPSLKVLHTFVENANQLDLLDAPSNPSSLLVTALLCASISTDCDLRIALDRRRFKTIAVHERETLTKTWELYSCGHIEALSELIAEEVHTTSILGEFETLFTTCLPSYIDENKLSASTLDYLLLKSLQNRKTIVVANVIGSVCAAFPWLPEILLLVRLQSLLSSVLDHIPPLDFTTVVTLEPKLFDKFRDGEFCQFECLTNTLGAIRSLSTSPQNVRFKIGRKELCFWR
ncbi:MAG: hypothetical protein J0M26_29575 [Planctomycetes bacterium]|nr:hypothetical protein [Planctomycetota bacterium]